MGRKGEVSYDPESKIWTSLDKSHIFNPEAGLGAILLFCLEKTPNKVTQINADDGSVMTCAELRSKSIRVAINLNKMGFKQGDVVSTASKNVPDLVPIIFGCWLIGVAVNPLDFALIAANSYRLYEMVKPKLIICDRDNYQGFKEFKLKSKLMIFGDESIQQLFEEIEDEENFNPPKLHDPANTLALIMGSSGTTGPSKGVKLSHAILTTHTMHYIPVTNEDVYLIATMPYWISGFMALLPSIVGGSTRVTTTLDLTPELIERLVNEYKVTQVLMSNLSVKLLIKYLEGKGTNLPSIKMFYFGGAFVSQNLFYGIQRFVPNGKAITVYGSTEMAGIIAIHWNQEFRNGSIGRLIQQVQARIIDEDGKNLGPGEIGQICLRGKFPFLGYLANDEATRKALDSEGWFISGDIGYFDENNDFVYIDRKQDIIQDIYGGDHLSPSEFESLIDGLDDVVSVCVVGITDDSGFNLPAALIVKKKGSQLTEEDVKEYLGSRQKTSKECVLMKGGCYFVDQLPVTPTGKIMRKRALEIAEKLWTQRNK